jgi:hypothetical protein
MPVQIGNIKLYSLKELVNPLKVNMITIRRYVREGRLKGQKVGQKWYVTEESLQEFLFSSLGDLRFGPFEVGNGRPERSGGGE